MTISTVDSSSVYLECASVVLYHLAQWLERPRKPFDISIKRRNLNAVQPVGMPFHFMLILLKMLSSDLSRPAERADYLRLAGRYRIKARSSCEKIKRPVHRHTADQCKQQPATPEGTVDKPPEYRLETTWSVASRNAAMVSVPFKFGEREAANFEPIQWQDTRSTYLYFGE